MMDMRHAVSEKFDVIVNALIELNESDSLITTQQLVPLLAKAYDEILPAPAKLFVRPHQFINACLERESDFLKAINKDIRKKMFSLV